MSRFRGRVMGTPAEDRTDAAVRPPAHQEHHVHLQRLRAGLAGTGAMIERGALAFSESVELLNRLDGRAAAPSASSRFAHIDGDGARAFGPDDLAAMSEAFTQVLRALRLNDRVDGLTDVIAQQIIALAIRGERDPIRLRDEVLNALKDGRAGVSRKSDTSGI